MVHDRIFVELDWLFLFLLFFRLLAGHCQVLRAHGDFEVRLGRSTEDLPVLDAHSVLALSVESARCSVSLKVQETRRRRESMSIVPKREEKGTARKIAAASGVP